ncbi:MAG: DUF4019 domain-containing protein [Sphingomonadales bacterium]|nr:DUF4019 domain-containing protein [Sphingomonadales bacterium]
MTTGYQALTEKEKETLRLLVSGYDAKSMARHLGLSVHTVNERLRDARRKMATSSSREAARLLREAEGPHPELLGDKALGDASGASLLPRSAHPAKASDMVRRNGWLIGGLAMSLTLALLALASLGGGAQMAASTKHEAEPTSAPAEAAVVNAARQWLALVDAKDWNGSWNGTSSVFKSQNTLAVWSDAASRVHGQFGPARSRELVTVEDVPAPPRGYYLVKFRTSYTNKAQGTETLSLIREDGAWKVAGIYVD